MLLTPEQTKATIEALAVQLCRGLSDPHKRVVVGIRRGGALVARLLRDQLAQCHGIELPLGFLDITFYRDDLDTIGPNPVVGATDMSMDLDDKRIILVDDVLFTGRTIRAALNALFDYGRPERVDLVVLVDRGFRQLPIQPDFVGMTVATGPREFIKLHPQQDEGYPMVVRRLI
ncbi:MAG: bifunctional pyr operon transcriptional regulator/uracil phosphoribosyltransferase PyrR [Magnetococcales bacterium]|nr:bifunctional pyr operon transcriptional regulator/uracil phosphoribosyltransferase PyrR [Magnetococcales bacterium]